MLCVQNQHEICRNERTNTQWLKLTLNRERLAATLSLARSSSFSSSAAEAKEKREENFWTLETLDVFSLKLMVRIILKVLRRQWSK